MHAGTRPGCRVCGGQEVEVDEVLETGVLRLAACGRCGHRWTERPLLAASRRLGPAATERLEAA